MILASLKCGAGGRHEIHGPDGTLFELDERELRDYARKHLRMTDAGGASVKMSEPVAAILESEGGPSGELRHLVKQRQQRDGIDENLALSLTLSTPEGQEIWERKRRRDLTESQVLSRFTQDKR